MTLAVTTTTVRLVGVISIMSARHALEHACAASALCLLEPWLRHWTALRGYRKREKNRGKQTRQRTKERFLGTGVS